MNCELCRKEIETYLADKLAPDMKTQVDAHLEKCSDCREILRMERLAQKVIEHEKETAVNPFISTRVMSRIEETKTEPQSMPAIIRALRPVIIAASLAAAVFAGVVIGKHYSPVSEKLPMELALIDDAALESIDVLSNE